MWIRISILPLLMYIGFGASGQGLVSGFIKDETGHGIPDAAVQLRNSDRGTTTDSSGYFAIYADTELIELHISHLQFESKTYPVRNPDKAVTVTLKIKTTELAGIEIVEVREQDKIQSFTELESISARRLPSVFGDFNKILVTLPGVTSNNELSSAYSVRGGNFDENLVYVNDIPVYRPFLSNAGRQEGLSFINPDLVGSVEFYAGGWEAKYGDKLSSSLNIEYKAPDKVEGSVTMGLLGGTAYAGGKSGDHVSYLVGARHRDSRYLLGTLEVKGQYFPTYTDVQSLLTFDLSGKKKNFVNKTKLNWLLAYGRNRYLTIPRSGQTDFGSIQQNFRLETAFEGVELLNYDTYQTGFRLTHWFNDRLRSHLIGSALFTSEKEQFDVIGAYRLSDVSTAPGSNLEKSVVIRGIGSNYEYARNSLEASIYTAENRYEFLAVPGLMVESGAGITVQDVHDQLNEYTYIDSADYVSLESSIFNDLRMSASQLYGYVQATTLWKDSIHALNSGVRVNYWDYNGQWLISPRVAYRFSPDWKKKTTFKLSAGIYQQPPFYRELRDQTGNLVNVNAQSSIHLIGGYNRLFYMWDRPFRFDTDIYYKILTNIIPYDIDNVRLRYYPDIGATGYAGGMDFRIHGEFIKGTQSWVSLGFLRTRENLEGDNRGYIRRPSDQFLTLSVFFEDHMPNDPTLRINLNLVLASGFPFGPPERMDLRNSFQGDEYYRADIGLSKSFDLSINNFFQTLWVRAEVLNALGADNTLSYTWIKDVAGAQFAVPNSLSARFLNIKFTAEL